MNSWLPALLRGWNCCWLLCAPAQKQVLGKLQLQPTPLPRGQQQARVRLLLGLGDPGISIHLHSFLWVLSSGKVIFESVRLCFERITPVMMDGGKDELSPESWQKSELEKLMAGLVLGRQQFSLPRADKGQEGCPLSETPGREALRSASC